MKRFLAFLFICFFISISLANECQIKEITPKEETNSFIFKTTLQKNLFIYTPQPKEALLSSDGVIYIYDKDNIIGFITAREKFQKFETIEKTIQKSYFYDCSKPIIKFGKSNFDIFVIESNLNDKPKISALIIDKTDDSYFYLLSFIGFSKDQAIQMLIGK